MEFINQKVEEEEFYGRQGLLELQKLYPKYFKHQINFSEDPSSVYDAYWIIYDENFNIKKRVLVEIKQRTDDYDEYILEDKKYKSLLKYRESLYFSKDEMNILYINFTPSKTIIWNLDNIDVNRSVLTCNKTTVDSRYHKVNKSVLYLTPDSGKTINYILNKNNILKKNKIELVLEKTKKGLEKVFGF